MDRELICDHIQLHEGDTVGRQVREVCIGPDDGDQNPMALQRGVERLRVIATRRDAGAAIRSEAGAMILELVEAMKRPA